MYRLHTVDIYLWTANDASMFLDSLRRVVQPHQLQILADPSAITPTSAVHHEHKIDTMSPLIANLERAAISHESHTPSPRGSMQAYPGPPQAAFPGPPQTAFPGPQVARASTASPGAADPGFAPMAYNPAAPAAPEPIAHREKTPPPVDAAEGTGLMGGPVHGAPPSYSNPLQASFTPQPTSGPYTPGPPTPGQGFSGPPGVQRTNTGGSMPPPPQSCTCYWTSITWIAITRSAPTPTLPGLCPTPVRQHCATNTRDGSERCTQAILHSNRAGSTAP